MSDLHAIAVRGLPALGPGDDLAALIAARIALDDGDVVVVAQKAVSKIEAREVALATIEPSAEARTIAGADEDPRFIELVLRESRRIVRRRGALLICETRHGFVCASAGVDRSNTSRPDHAIPLPLDPDASARRLRDDLRRHAAVAVIVSDSFGRPFRQGIVGVAIGCAGIEPATSYLGAPDDAGRAFQGTIVHVADELAALADLVMGPAGGVPVVVVRGAGYTPGERGAAELTMPAARDLFGSDPAATVPRNGTH